MCKEPFITGLWLLAPTLVVGMLKINIKNTNDNN